jgi:hypothetical protein
LQLGKKRRATVRTFKGESCVLDLKRFPSLSFEGMVMVDIREFYGEADDEKPGKKGISLTIEQV